MALQDPTPMLQRGMQAAYEAGPLAHQKSSFEMIKADQEIRATVQANAEKKAISDIYSKYDPSSPEFSKAINSDPNISAQTKIKFGDQALERQKTMIQTQAAVAKMNNDTLELVDKHSAIARDVADGGLSALATVYQNSKLSDSDKKAAAKFVEDDTIKQLRDNHPSPEAQQQITELAKGMDGSPDSILKLKAFRERVGSIAQHAADQLAKNQKAKDDARNARQDARDKNTENYRHQDIELRQREEQRKEQQDRPYEAMGPDNKPHMFRSNVGGPPTDLGLAAPKGNVQGQGQANSRTSTTVMGALEDVDATMSNIKNMPFTTGTIFKIDKANGIMEAPATWLKGAWTTEQSQEYNQHLHGIGVAMSLIENNGTRPSLAQIKQYTDKYEVPPGASRYTAYMSLAQMRQDLEQKVKSIDSSNMYSPEQKKEAHRILDEVRDAIPYTVKNLQEMKYKGRSRLGSAENVKEMSGVSGPTMTTERWNSMNSGDTFVDEKGNTRRKP